MDCIVIAASQNPVSKGYIEYLKFTRLTDLLYQSLWQWTADTQSS